MTLSPPPDSHESQPPAPSSGTAGIGLATMRSRIVLFAVLSIACVAAAGTYVVRAMLRDGSATRSRAGGSTVADEGSTALALPGGPTLLFSNLAPGTNDRNRAAIVPIAAPQGPRGLTRLACQRIHFAAGRGLCLGEGDRIGTLDDNAIATDAYIFAADFQIKHHVPLGGFPSRARVSPDGRYGAMTVFVSGHSYADAGFSTQTTLIDLESGAKLGNLEQFALSRDGERFQAIDRNFWGVTFAAGGDRFYATLGTGGHTYLVEGSVGARQMRVLRENVECPSLSPDGKRLAFKKRVGGLFRAVWRFHVLDLSTMSETPLSEPRSIDDQIEWLDDGQVLYGDGATVWVAAADGTGQPRKFVSQATSPTVLRTALTVNAAAGNGAGPGADNRLTVGTADLGVAITVSASNVPVGAVLRYTVTVTNYGPADATSLKVDHLLPPDTTFVGTPTSTNPGQGYGCALLEDQRRVSCDTILLPNGSTWTMSLNVRAGAAGTLIARAIVSGAERDPHPNNDTAAVRTTVHAAR
jgi:uncharacterized repeat protein (TIGR01451 family)